MSEDGSETRQCTRCGKDFQIPPGFNGKRPSTCPEHRRSKYNQYPTEEAFEASKERRALKGRMQRAAVKKTDLRAKQRYLDAAKLARRLARIPDPRAAADATGLAVDDDELAELVAMVAAYHQGLRDDDPMAIAQLLGDAIVDITADLQMKASLVAPSIAGNVVRQLAHVREAYVGKASGGDFTQVSLVLVGPNGENEELKPKTTGEK